MRDGKEQNRAVRWSSIFSLYAMENGCSLIGEPKSPEWGHRSLKIAL